MKKIIFFSLLIAVFSCKTNQNSVGENGKECSTIGTVKDFSGLDGCGFLIVLENGDKLNPAKISDADFELKAGQKIKFSYKEMPDMTGICMSEKAIVEVICIKEISADDAALCADTKNPFEIDWMDKALDRHNPQQVIKYKTRDGFSYLFKGIPLACFYDCKGNFICKTNGADDDCFKNNVQTAGKGKIIWQGEGIWD
ncbi:MAG: hypothetical protein ACI9XO_000147 [Paraglaciecola sp.]|jgi:hypothetical protein